MSCQRSDVCMCAEVFYSFPLHLNPVHVCVMFSRKVYYSLIYLLFFFSFFPGNVRLTRAHVCVCVCVCVCACVCVCVCV